MVTVGLLIVITICGAIGAFTGLVLGGLFADIYLAIIAGFLAMIVTFAIRNIKIPQLVVIYSSLSVQRGVPWRVIICSIIASLIGSIAAVQVATMTDMTSSVAVGAWAGIFVGILMAMIAILSERSPNVSAF
jgi:hypothetical protein